MLGSCMYASWHVDSREVDVAVTASNRRVMRWCGYGMLWRWLLLQLQALQNIIKPTRHEVVGNHWRTVWARSMILKPTIKALLTSNIQPQQLATIGEDTMSLHTTHWNACCMFCMNCMSFWMFSTPFAILSSLVFTEMSYFKHGCLWSGSNDSGFVVSEKSDSSAVSSQVRSMLPFSKSVCWPVSLL